MTATKPITVVGVDRRVQVARLIAAAMNRLAEMDADRVWGLMDDPDERLELAARVAWDVVDARPIRMGWTRDGVYSRLMDLAPAALETAVGVFFEECDR